MSDALRAELARVASRLGADGVDFVLERPRDAGHGDLATNLAMVLAKRERANPRKTAERVLEELQLSSGLVVDDRDRRARASSTSGWRRTSSPRPHRRDPRPGRRLRPERPSAPGSRSTSSSSPPIPPARCTWATAAAPRWATPSPRCSSGPATRVTREFYINDAGVQIDRLAQSLWARVQQAAGREAAIPEGGYHGEYLARERAARCSRAKARASPTCRPRRASGACRAHRAPRCSGEEQDRDLADFGVRFDVHVARSRRSTIAAGCERALDAAGASAASPTRTTARSGSAPPQFGDDKDRVLRKSDGTLTYLVPDIAYHIDKHERGFDRVDRRLGRRSPRLHPADARGARGPRLSAGVLRRGAGAAGEGGAGRGRGEDVEAARRVRHPARPVRGGRRRRRALLLPHAEGRDARSTSTSTWPSSRPTRIRSSTCRWRTPG